MNNVRDIVKISPIFGTWSYKEVSGYTSFSVVCADVHLPLSVKFDESAPVIMWPGDTIYLKKSFKKYSYYVANNGARFNAGTKNNYYIALGNENYQENYPRSLNNVTYQAMGDGAYNAVFYACINNVSDKMPPFDTVGAPATLLKLYGVSNIEKVSVSTSNALTNDTTLGLFFYSAFVDPSNSLSGAKYFKHIKLMAGVENFVELLFPEKSNIVGFSSFADTIVLDANTKLTINAEGKMDTNYYEALTA